MKTTHVLWLLFLLLALSISYVGGFTTKDGIVTVEQGDNLWSISESLPDFGHSYLLLWAGRLDSFLTDDPDLIYPDMRFVYRPQSAKMPSDSTPCVAVLHSDTTVRLLDSIRANTDAIAESARESFSVSILKFVGKELVLAIVGGVVVMVLGNLAWRRFFGKGAQTDE